MSRYVRARGNYKFTDHAVGTVEVRKGDLVEAHTWYVVDDTSNRFEPVDDSHPDVAALYEQRQGELRAMLERVGPRALDRPGVRVSGQRRDGDQPVFPSAHRSTSWPGTRTRDLARSAVDSLHQAGDLPDHAAERVEALVTRSGSLREQNTAAAWVLAAGAAAYRSAFAKVLADPAKGHMLWTQDEQRAYAAVEEMRAMSLTDNAGGYMVPLSLDPAVMLTNDGSNNPIRQLARVVQTASDVWKGVSSEGVTAEWLAEGIEAADGTPTLAQPEVKIHKGSVFVPYSFEVGMDAIDLLGQLSLVMNDAAGLLQAEAFTNGTGIGEPAGVITGATTHVTTTAADTFAAGDVYALQAALPPRFQANATWAAPLAVLNVIDQFETANGSKIFPDLGSDRLLRKPVAEVSDMSAALTAGSTPLLYGDVKAAYVIADRVGSSVELIPNLLGANGRPTAQRGAYLWFRTGGAVVSANALRLLEVDAP